MEEESQHVEEIQQPVEQSTPEQEVTATPDSEVSKPEEANKPSKVFTQEELDAQIGKRLAIEKRKWERSQQAAQSATQNERQIVQPASGDMTPDQFETPEQFQQYLDQRAEQLANAREAAKRSQQVLEQYHEKEVEAFEKYDDFEQVAYNPNVPITDIMAQTIRESDIGPDVAYYLGSNLAEAKRISQLSPYLQAKEIGKIEARIASEPPGKKTSNAPAPVTPVKAKGGENASYDTTDPRSTKTMTTSEWIEAERQRQIRLAQAGRR